MFQLRRSISQSHLQIKKENMWSFSFIGRKKIQVVRIYVTEFCRKIRPKCLKVSGIFLALQIIEVQEKGYRSMPGIFRAPYFSAKKHEIFCYNHGDLIGNKNHAWDCHGGHSSRIDFKLKSLSITTSQDNDPDINF